MIGQGPAGLLQHRLRLGRELLGPVELAAVDGADGVGRVAKGVTAERQRLLPGGMLGVEVLAHVVHEGGKALGRLRLRWHRIAPFCYCWRLSQFRSSGVWLKYCSTPNP